MSLDKVLRLAADGSPAEPEGAFYVRAAAEKLDELALLLADSDDDEDDDSDEQGDDEDNDSFAARMKARRAKRKGKGKAKKAVKASALLDAMLALSNLQGGEEVSLSVLSTADRKKASAHTIAGSTDYPIPDKGHLQAAIARYKEGKLAGHSAAEVKAHIMSRAKALGMQVSLSDPGDSSLVRLARDGKQTRIPADVLVPMYHGPHVGQHSHPYEARHVVNGDHYHNGDSRHSPGHGPEY